MTLFVDKDVRKYFEAKVEKFDEDFQPNLDFLQSILNKVSIHTLPLWYPIPRSTDNIFASIIETYFSTPKIYSPIPERVRIRSSYFESYYSRSSSISI